MSFFSKFRKKKSVSIIHLHGIISAQGQKQNLNIHTVKKPLERAFKAKPAEILLSINCPGGAPAQTNLIYEYIQLLSRRYAIPVTSFIEDVGASGGYWLACSGTKIFALESSIIGSIGVISAGFGFHKLIEKIGVERRIYTSGESKSQLDAFQPEKSDDIKHVKLLQNHIHENFIAYVKQSRGNRINPDHHHLFTGSFWAGQTAKELGLIDEIGDIYSYIDKNYGKNVGVKEITLTEKSFLKKLLFSNQKPASFLLNVLEEADMWSRYKI